MMPLRTVPMIAALLVLRSAPVHAQTKAAAEDLAVVAVIDDDLAQVQHARIAKATDGKGGAMWILRYPHGKQRNIIALRRSTATSALLLSGIQALITTQQKEGKTPANFRVLTSPPVAGNAPDSPTRSLFDALMHARPERVRGVGIVPALTIPLTQEARLPGPPGKSN